MWDDPIVAETCALRSEIAAEYNFDIESLGAYFLQLRAADAEMLIQEAVHAISNRQDETYAWLEDLLSVPA